MADWPGEMACNAKNAITPHIRTQLASLEHAMLQDNTGDQIVLIIFAATQHPVQ